ncbi:uncharacterized protein LOC106161730 [Lingula anatina]|uniref:Uncharacterized protein LOC106161730 n=1 Tax=Lingula anatina TaxID=7574 RepID=A0A1S3I7F3_LINAN|nr:uncharacterized protein LOC106161730 [Lingula anatina]|eukprot:XP_013394210.1 uncharacterized protein LOC106161730 [Lingula anatina]
MGCQESKVVDVRPSADGKNGQSRNSTGGDAKQPEKFRYSSQISGPGAKTYICNMIDQTCRLVSDSSVVTAIQDLPPGNWKEVLPEFCDADFSIYEADDIPLPSTADNEPAILDPNEQLDIQEYKKDKEVWRAKRKVEFEYMTPLGTASEPVMEVEFAIAPENQKREIHVMSDIHLSCYWSDGMADKVRYQMDQMLTNERIHTYVMLGDVFEMWLDDIHQVPPTIEEQAKKWTADPVVEYFTSSVRRMVDEKDVNVFFVRGNHDHEITAEMVQKFFGPKVRFVEGTLIYKINDGGGNQYRIRFAHGHDWDLFNSYALRDTGELIAGYPVGYYVARAVASSQRFDGMHDVEHLLLSFLQGLLRTIPKSLEDDLSRILAGATVQKKLTRNLMEGAFGTSKLDGEWKLVIAEDKFVTLRTILNYPYIRLLNKLRGDDIVFHMVKAAMGNYDKLLYACAEDVVVLAHTHRWVLEKIDSFTKNDLIYANTGAWTKCAKEYSYVTISPPGGDQDGKVVVCHGEN